MRIIRKKKKGFGSFTVKKGSEIISTKTTEMIMESKPTDGTLVNVGSHILISENYNSVKLEVGITVPCFFKGRNTAAKEGWDFVDSQLAEHINAAKSLLREI